MVMLLTVSLKSTTDHWRRRPVLVLCISDGHELGTASVYTMKYFALATGLYLSGVIIALHVTGCNAKFVLDNIPRCIWKLNYLHKEHHYLLQCIDGSFSRGAPTAFNVRGQADKLKANKDSRGRNWPKLTDEDGGNYISQSRWLYVGQLTVDQRWSCSLPFIVASQLY